MGLDMYLNAKKYLWSDDKLAETLSEKFPELNGNKIKHVTAELGYWRKCNQIHKWFVDNVQEGTDDCGTYDISFEQLQELLDLIDKVLADKGKASALLPNTTGFFFGSQDYDKYYFDDLQYTKELLEKLLNKKESLKGWYLEYTSSW